MSHIHLPHSFFDPSSRYNRLRSCCDPDEKLLGYFDWLRYEREQGRPQPAPLPNAARGGPICIRLDDPLRHVGWEHMDYPQGVEELEGRFYVEFQLRQEDHLSRMPRCRILLMDANVLKRLREGLAAEGRRLEWNDEDAIRQLFTEEFLENSFEVCRVLSALPDLEGNITEDGSCLAQKVVPFRSPNIAPGTWILVVYEPPAAAGRGNS
ncbi:MAG TPA: hypothetical protein VH643_04235 [Gemmataceae bacterium]|jgi:hypothetical protein